MRGIVRTISRRIVPAENPSFCEAVLARVSVTVMSPATNPLSCADPIEMPPSSARSARDTEPAPTCALPSLAYETTCPAIVMLTVASSSAGSQVRSNPLRETTVDAAGVTSEKSSGGATLNVVATP